MEKNIFTFGDLYFLQKCGTAMGAKEAIKYATIYYASHENNTLIPKCQEQMIKYKRFYWALHLGTTPTRPFFR